MAKKRIKNYVPAAATMAYSGVHESELEYQKRWLKSHGAKEISVEEDEGLYDDNGPYYVIHYTR